MCSFPMICSSCTWLWTQPFTWASSVNHIQVIFMSEPFQSTVNLRHFKNLLFLVSTIAMKINTLKVIVITAKSQYNVLSFTIVFSFTYNFEIPGSVSHIINVKIFHFCVAYYCIFFSSMYRNLNVIIIKIIKISYKWKLVS